MSWLDKLLSKISREELTERQLSYYDAAEKNARKALEAGNEQEAAIIMLRAQQLIEDSQGK